MFYILYKNNEKLTIEIFTLFNITCLRKSICLTFKLYLKYEKQKV